jgi:hypothetical protein
MTVHLYVAMTVAGLLSLHEYMPTLKKQQCFPYIQVLCRFCFYLSWGLYVFLIGTRLAHGGWFNTFFTCIGLLLSIWFTWWIKRFIVRYFTQI